MKMKFLYTLAIFALIAIFKAYGADSDKENDGTLLNLSATETTQVEPDLLIATLRVESESKQAAEVQTKINQTMKKALDLAAENEKLNVSTEQYSVYKYSAQVKQGEKEKEIWKGSQSIVIKGKSAKNILDLSGDLQEMGLLMSDLHYEISSEKLEAVRASQGDCMKFKAGK